MLVPNPWYQESDSKETTSEPIKNWLYEVLRGMDSDRKIKRSPQNGNCQPNIGQFPRRQRIHDLIHK